MQTDLKIPQINLSIHIKPLRSFIYTYMLDTNTRVKNKSLTGLPNSVSPKLEYLYIVHYQHMQMTNWVMQEVKNENKLYNKNFVSHKYILFKFFCLCVAVFLLPTHIESFCLFHFVDKDCEQ